MVNKTELTEEKIQRILSNRFLTYSSKKYEMENLFVFDWESDYLCITNSNVIYECEIKISRADFKNDFKHKKKKHLLMENANTTDYTKLPDYFYYAVPDGLISVDEVPDYAGLIYIKHGASNSNDILSYWCQIVKNPTHLHHEKMDISKLNLEKKFYYAYRNWKGESFLLKNNIDNMKQEAQKLINEQGGTMGLSYSQLEEQLKQDKETIRKLEGAKNLYKDSVEYDTKYIRKLQELLKENNIDFSKII